MFLRNFLFSKWVKNAETFCSIKIMLYFFAVSTREAS